MQDNENEMVQAIGELRHMWRDITGGLRSFGRGVSSQLRADITDVDGAGIERPGFWRRGWRHFRGTSAPVQVAVALVAFGLWFWLLVSIVQSDSGGPSHPAPSPPTATSSSEV